jgi:hypothetical protein
LYTKQILACDKGHVQNNYVNVYQIEIYIKLNEYRIVIWLMPFSPCSGLDRCNTLDDQASKPETWDIKNCNFK